jgi:glutamine cyclotransferase
MPSGKVLGRIDLDNLARQAQQRFTGANELNGIAYNEATSTFLITGKNWPIFFELKLN